MNHSSGECGVGKSGIGSNSYDAINSISANANGNVYARGYFQCAIITFGTLVLTNFYNLYQDLFLVKFDSSGNAQCGKSNEVEIRMQGMPDLPSGLMDYGIATWIGGDKDCVPINSSDCMVKS